MGEFHRFLNMRCSLFFPFLSFVSIRWGVFIKKIMGFCVPGFETSKWKIHERARGSYRSNCQSAVAKTAPPPLCARSRKWGGTTETAFLGSVLLMCYLLHDCCAMAKQLQHLGSLNPKAPSGAQLQLQQHPAFPGFAFPHRRATPDSRASTSTDVRT